MSNIKHASIIPLIGGETIGQSQAFGCPPSFMLSYEPFASNDSHIRNYYADVPYHVIGKDVFGTKSKVDVINAVCPCAGLSTLSPSPSSDSKSNDWLIESTNFALSTYRPKVLWGENAPCLASKLGEPVVQKMMQAAEAHGYTMTLYRTQSWLHGLPQTRERSFYFFWREKNRIPILPFFKRNEVTIEQFFTQHENTAKHASQQDVTNDNIPSKDPMYRYVLETLENGITHKKFHSLIPKTMGPIHWVEDKDGSFGRAAKWLRKHGYEKQATRCETMDAKLAAGGNVMRRGVEVPKIKIGAFVGHFPTLLTHPTKDRFLTYRECMSLMGMPLDFTLLNPRKSLNHVCQNVPVTTAFDMATGIRMYLNDELPFHKGSLMLQRNHNKHVAIYNGIEFVNINKTTN